MTGAELTGTDEEEVLAANTELYDAFEAGDLDRMAAVWLDGAAGDGLVCVHPGWLELRGRGPVLRSWAMIMANTSYIQFFLTDVVVSLGGDVAVVTCAENVLTGMTAPEGGPAGFAGSRVVATNVFRRTAAGWRLWVHHASPVLSAPDDAREGGRGDEGGVGRSTRPSDPE